LELIDMHILKPPVTLFITALTVQAFVPTETGVSQVAEQICDTACYNSYHYLMGACAPLDYHTSEDWPDYASSHQFSADQICSADLCSGCPFCSLNQDTFDNTVNFKISLENRHDANDDKLISCLDCQKYVDSCLISVKEEASNVRDDLDCELEVCTKGPVHCHSGGQCERLICKVLECLDTCDAQKLQDKCNSTCDSKRRIGDAQAKMCRDGCDQGISCYQYCVEKICCVGPAHCRVAGNHYRCGGIANVQCEFWKQASSGLSP
ncbi:hypothetical protein J1614_006444, partial [Plenodomus biglobosus]